MARAKKEGSFINCKIKSNIFNELNRYSEESLIPKTAIVEKALEEYFKKIKEREK